MHRLGIGADRRDVAMAQLNRSALQEFNHLGGYIRCHHPARCTDTCRHAKGRESGSAVNLQNITTRLRTCQLELRVMNARQVVAPARFVSIDRRTNIEDMAGLDGHRNDRAGWLSVKNAPWRPRVAGRTRNRLAPTVRRSARWICRAARSRRCAGRRSGRCSRARDGCSARRSEA